MSVNWFGYYESETELENFKEFVLKNKDEINKVIKFGNNNYSCTPLHYAVRDGSLEMVKILIENGAKLSIKDSIGFYPDTQTLSCTDPVYCCYNYNLPEICVAYEEVLEYLKTIQQK